MKIQIYVKYENLNSIATRCIRTYKYSEYSLQVLHLHYTTSYAIFELIEDNARLPQCANLIVFGVVVIHCSSFTKVVEPGPENTFSAERGMLDLGHRLLER